MANRKYLAAEDASAYLRLSKAQLAKLRCYGGGPTYARLGSRIVYRVEDLDRWVEGRLMRATGIPHESETSAQGGAQ